MLPSPSNKFSEKDRNRFVQYFEIKTSNYNMITHCSRVDESFADFLFESVQGNISDDSAGDGLNYENLIDNLLQPNNKRHLQRFSRPGSGPIEPKVVDDNADG